MDLTVPRSGIAVQSHSAADCRHSREPFDQGFHVVSRRGDISSDAKVVHAFLVSLYRSGLDLTQRKMAAELGLTRHRVWAAIQELIAADLVKAIRYGLGRPNGYALLGIEQADLDGKRQPETGVRPVRKGSSGQSGNPTRARHSTPTRRRSPRAS
jgi:hypothetical protein